MTRKLIRRTLMIVMVGAFAFVPAFAASAAPVHPATDPNRHIAYSPFGDFHGWGRQVWDGDIAGISDPWNDHVRAFDFLASGAGQLCVAAHLSGGFGWQNERCGDSTLFEVGAPYGGLDFDGLSWRTDTGTLCINFQIVQDGQLFWSGPLCTFGAQQPFLAEWPGGRITAIAAWYE